ncbi:MAG: PAS domain S-box protein [Flavobacteriales bacterium]|nr:PAS domain S-box protein [Flavobacteriales bacterium]
MSGTADAEGSRTQELARAYLELRRQYEDLVDRNMAGVFRTTLDGRFLECNASMARILGYPDRDALMQVNAKVLYLNEEDRTEYLKELTERGHLINHTIRLRHFSGRTVHVLENVYLDRSEDGITTIAGTLIDRSPQVQAELEQQALLENYRRLVEHAPEGILIVQDGLVRYGNPTADLLMGAPSTGTVLADAVEPTHRPVLAACLEEARREGEGAPVELALRRADGSGGRVLLSASRTFHEGAPAVQVHLRDVGRMRATMEAGLRAQMAEEVNRVLRQEIMDHRRTQEELRRAKRFARSLVDSSLDMIIAVDEAGLITEFNPAAMVRFGYEADEVLGRPARMLYAHGEEHARIQGELNAHGAFAGEVHNVDHKGEVFLTFLAASRLYDEQGSLLGSMGVSRDITHAKRDQEALRASEERYRDLFENAMDLIQSVTPDGRFEYVNRAWRDTLGYTSEEVAHITVWDVVHPDHREAFRAQFEGAFAGEPGGPITTVLLAKDGRSITVEGNRNVRRVDGRPVATRGIFRDVTREHEARGLVVKQEATLRALFESSEHMFWSVDERIALTSFNQGYARMIERLYGTRPEINRDGNIPRKRFASETYHAFWEEKYREAFTGRPLRFETELTDARGRYVSNEVFLSPVFSADGRVREVFGVGHEITEQKLAERTVREQAARLTAIFENSANMMVWTLDQEFRITSLNDHFRDSSTEAFGYTPRVGDAFLEHMLERVAPAERRSIRTHYEAAMKGRPRQFEVEMHDTDGRTRWVENFLNPIRVDGRVAEISCLAYGITDKKEAERQLIERLRENEVLLKEVHHRVKNNLQIISSILNLQTAYVGHDQRMLDLIRESQDRIRSMSFIHESLYQNKTFSSVDLSSYIDRLARNLVLSYSLSGKVELRTDLERVELVLDQAIPCGLILNELISNALKHGYPDGAAGIITIALSCRDGRVTVEVADDGIGLPEGFDAERDANLGLQLVATLSEQLDARLERESGPGVRYFLTFDRIK